MGMLAQTNVEIREAERRHHVRRAEHKRLRQPIMMVDRMLYELEELNVRGMKRVPLSYDERLRTLVLLVADVPNCGPAVENLKVKIGIGKLMDALFGLQEALFVQRHGGGTYEPEDDLIFAA